MASFSCTLISVLEEILEEVAQDCRVEGTECELVINLRARVPKDAAILASCGFQYCAWQICAKRWDEERHKFLLRYAENCHDHAHADESIDKVGWSSADIAVRYHIITGIDGDYSVLMATSANDSATSHYVCERLEDSISFLIP